MEIKRIILSKPNIFNEFVSYDNKLQPRMNFSNSILEKIYIENEQAILAIVENEICRYVKFETNM